jgi:DnaJ homolog subfamily C member 19
MIAKLLVGLVLAGLVYLWWRRQIVQRAPMRPSEARALLGIGEGASGEDIRAAHRRLIAKVHPDAGGSQGLATRVNAARDALLNELKQR